MSASNGGRGRPPVPPEGHGPPAQQQEIPITKEVTYQSQATVAQREQEGAKISFVVFDGSMPVTHTYLIGEQGKKTLLEVLSGGLKIPA